MHVASKPERESKAEWQTAHIFLMNRKENVMKRTAWMIIAIVLGILTATVLDAQADMRTPPAPANQKDTIVEIDYGNGKPSRIMRIAPAQGKTVLEILQTVATVETHPVGPYVFVVSIDGVQGRRGETAWYYTIDDRAATELAYSKRLDGTEGRIKWSYQKDVCSWRVDEKANPAKKDGAERR
jgi:hypothetical protein